CFVGPVLIGVQGVINGFGLKTAAADYAAMPQESSKTLPQFTNELDATPPTISTVNVYTDANVLEVETVKGDFYSVNYKGADEKNLIGPSTDSVDSTSEIGKADVDNSVTTDGKIGDARASKV